MKIVEFYRGERGNQNGDMLEEIWNWPHGFWEADHDFVQWLFPSNEQSRMNHAAPVLTAEESAIFSSDPELQNRVKQSFIHMLDFLEFKLARDDDVIVIEPKVETPWWLKRFNHNMLRVTRILKCLRLTGLERYAKAFYEALQPFQPTLSVNSWEHWAKAVSDDLW